VRIARINKTTAAKAAGISRRSVIRYAQSGLISQDHRGRVLLSEVSRVWNTPCVRGVRASNRADQDMRPEGDSARDSLMRVLGPEVARLTALSKSKSLPLPLPPSAR
jgi:hypothetical protein